MSPGLGVILVIATIVFVSILNTRSINRRRDARRDEERDLRRRGGGFSI